MPNMLCFHASVAERIGETKLRELRESARLTRAELAELSVTLLLCAMLPAETNANVPPEISVAPV